MKAHILKGKRKKPDKRRDSAAYWESRLQRMGLGMESGHVSWICYGYVVTDFDYDGRVAYKPDIGDMEREEWPISLC